MENQRLYSLKQACDIINSELSLTTREQIYPYTYHDWRKAGVIQFDPDRERVGLGGTFQLNEQELHEFKDVAFIHRKLGVIFRKLKDTRAYINALRGNG